MVKGKGMEGAKDSFPPPQGYPVVPLHILSLKSKQNMFAGKQTGWSSLVRDPKEFEHSSEPVKHQVPQSLNQNGPVETALMRREAQKSAIGFDFGDTAQLCPEPIPRGTITSADKGNC